jgi:hypothetical protein
MLRDPFEETAKQRRSPLGTFARNRTAVAEKNTF